MKIPAAKEKKVEFLLPLKWSLHYIMTAKEWEDFRSRVKEFKSGWNKCSCPNKCRANDCDEQWEYDNDKHTKRFVRAKFICRGCHWLKTPPFRVETWLKDESGLLGPPTRVPHIYRCLGWTKAQVKKLREDDLKQDQRQNQELKKIKREVRAGKAEERYWDIDLSAMKQYGYSETEIEGYTIAMRVEAISREFGFRQ